MCVKMAEFVIKARTFSSAAVRLAIREFFVRLRLHFARRLRVKTAPFVTQQHRLVHAPVTLKANSVKLVSCATQILVKQVKSV